jgi:hypothetical protein
MQTPKIIISLITYKFYFPEFLDDALLLLLVGKGIWEMKPLAAPPKKFLFLLEGLLASLIFFLLLLSRAFPIVVFLDVIPVASDFSIEYDEAAGLVGFEGGDGRPDSSNKTRLWTLFIPPS